MANVVVLPAPNYHPRVLSVAQSDGRVPMSPMHVELPAEPYKLRDEYICWYSGDPRGSYVMPQFVDRPLDRFWDMDALHGHLRECYEGTILVERCGSGWNLYFLTRNTDDQYRFAIWFQQQTLETTFVIQQALPDEATQWFKETLRGQYRLTPFLVAVREPNEALLVKMRWSDFMKENV